MIYVDTSVALAHLLAEDRHPPQGFWQRELVTSRLFEYELWNAIRSPGPVEISRRRSKEHRGIAGDRRTIS